MCSLCVCFCWCRLFLVASDVFDAWIVFVLCLYCFCIVCVLNRFCCIVSYVRVCDCSFVECVCHCVAVSCCVYKVFIRFVMFSPLSGRAPFLFCCVVVVCLCWPCSNCLFVICLCVVVVGCFFFAFDVVDACIVVVLCLFCFCVELMSVVVYSMFVCVRLFVC